MRLRERFHNAGPDALSDYELLEMALFTAQPRRDMKPLAKSLLKKFGSFAEVIHAPEARLREVEGIGDASINQLKLIAAAASRIAKGQLRTAHPAVVMERRDRLLPDQHGVRRQGAVPHPVPRQAQSIDLRRGAADRHRGPHAGLSARGDKRALELSATAIILVHNHPSGDPTPSQADIQMTKAMSISPRRSGFPCMTTSSSARRACEFEGDEADLTNLGDIAISVQLNRPMGRRRARLKLQLQSGRRMQAGIESEGFLRLNFERTRRD